MAYRKIGVWGATGTLGKELTRALVESGLDVVPFSRNSTTVAGVPTQKLGSLVGFDAIVSVMGAAGMKDQIAVMEQAKKDGVKRFVPSQFGGDRQTLDLDFFKPKKAMFEAVEKAAFPDGWTAIANGFLDSNIDRFIEVKPEQSKIIVKGKGEELYPYTLRHDIGRVLAHTFKYPQAYKNSWVVVTNGWFTLNEIAEIVRSQHGQNFEIEHVELDDTTPILRLFELNNLKLLEGESQGGNLPVELADMYEHIRQIKWY